jgi:hypothetical protein
VSNAPSKPVSFSRPKVGYFSNRPRIAVISRSSTADSLFNVHCWTGGSKLLSDKSTTVITTQCPLTFKNRASYIKDGRIATLQMLHFIYLFSTTISTEYFKHATHSPFFSSKCRLLHYATFFGFCIIHILHTGCAKI